MSGLHYLLLICDSCTNMRQVEDLCEEMTEALHRPEAGEAQPTEVLVLSYGVTSKAKRGFILLKVLGPIPNGFTQQLRADAGITDFVFIVSSDQATLTFLEDEGDKQH